MARKVVVCSAFLVSFLAWGQSTPSAAAKSDPAKANARKTTQARATSRTPQPSVASQIEELRTEFEQRDAALQQKILDMQQQLDASRREIVAMKQAATAQTSAQAEQANGLAAGDQAVVNLKAAVSAVQLKSNALAATVQDNQVKTQEVLLKPKTIRYKGIGFTPGGFISGESAWRQHELEADIASPFNSIPFQGSDLAALTEFRMSARQTRASLLAESSAGHANLSAYLEFDLLGAGLTSNSNESNSYMPRLRHAWMESKWNDGWSVDVGQMWTLAVSNRKGISPIAGNAYLPDMIDAQYVVGFTWLRQPAVRIERNFNDRIWLAASAEGAQTMLSARNAPASFLYCAPGTANLTSTVNYTFDKAPDIVAKLTFEPGYGHYELKGVARFFRDRVYPNGPTSAAQAYNYNQLGDGFGAAASWNLTKKIDLSLNGLVGKGVGRYGTSQLPDVTVRPNGTLAPLLGGQGLATLDVTISPRWKLYAYGGDEYAGRKSFVNASGAGVGYGSPLNNNTGCNTEMAPSSSTTPAASTCNADTRSLYQGVVGFWYKPYVGEMGRMQYGLEYSYTRRSAWSGSGGGPKAGENMVFTSIRYYLP